MEKRTSTEPRTNIRSSFCADDRDPTTEQRLARLLELNDAADRARNLYRDPLERLEALAMTRPINSKEAFSYFGFLIGALPPAAIALKIVSEAAYIRPSTTLFVLVFLLASVTTGLMGFQLGKYIPAVLNATRDYRLPNRIAAVAFTGLVWGAASGAVGGLFLLVVGALFAAVFGGIVGTVAVPVFVFLHQSLRRGDFIELKHFLPISLAITFSLCAFILGL